MANSLKVLTLSKDQHALLNATTITHDSLDTRIKAEGLLHLFQTQDLAYSAHEMFVDEDTLKAWVTAWQENGLEGLSEGDLPYADTVYTDLALTHYLSEILNEYPDTYGIDADDWTVELLIEHLAEVTHREMGISEFTELMLSIGWQINPIRRLLDYGHGMTSMDDLIELTRIANDMAAREARLEQWIQDDFDRIDAFFENTRADE